LIIPSIKNQLNVYSFLLGPAVLGSNGPTLPPVATSPLSPQGREKNESGKS